MAAVKLVWTPTNENSDEHNPTFVLFCNEGMIAKYRADPSIPLVRIVQSFDVYMYETPGSEGKMVKPSNDILKQFFGTTNDTEIAQFMVKNALKQGEAKEAIVSTHISESLNPSRGARVGIMKMLPTVLIWFKSDLRTLDNPAFFNAIKKAQLQPVMNLVALYIVSPEDWKAHDVSKVKVDFILRNLRILSTKLWEDYRVPLLVRTVSSRDQIPSIMLQECNQLNVKHVLFNKEYEVNEAKRDKKVSELLLDNDIAVHSYDDQVVVPPNTLRSKSSNTVYTIYSFFRNSWYSAVHTNKSIYLKLYDSPAAHINAEDFSVKPDSVPDQIPGFELTQEKAKLMQKLYPAGEKVAHEKLEAFTKSKCIDDYDKNRNYPGLANGTSGLSPYLASGILSCKQCVVSAIEANNGKIENGKSGAVCWIQELIWRDFYRHILVSYPRVCMNKPFKLETAKIRWKDDEDLFKAWCEGRTGYPIVDAGMRQLNATGWMHNRLRMIVSSFLTKHLLQNWMKGEKYFMQQLIDGDFASNNGGWQWSASTGTDAQPYFRIFNPYTQSRKFDEDGSFIRKWVPELRNVPLKAIHCPDEVLGKGAVLKLGYPTRIVEHDVARKEAIEAFKEVMGKKDEEKSSSLKRKR